MSDKPMLTIDVKIRAGLRIMQWNANGLKNKMVTLEDKTRLLEIYIILIQESKLSSSDTNPKLKGYATIRKGRAVGRGGGLVTFIKEDIPFTVIDHSNGVPNSMLEILMTDIQALAYDSRECVLPAV